MRINSIKLRDFRCHHSFSTTLDDLNFFVGANASGKTSIAQAVEFALTGKCSVTDAAGRNAEDLILIGAKEFEIVLDVTKDDVSGKVARSKSARAHELTLNDRALPLPEAQRRIYEVLGVTGDVLSACLNSGRFLAMDEKAQKTLLAQVLASDSAKAPQSIVDDVKHTTGEWGLGTPDGVIDSIDNIDMYHKFFYEKRTETNRDLKSLGSMEEPSEPVAGYADQKSALDDLRRQLTLAEKSKSGAEQRHSSLIESNKRTRRMIDARKSEAEARTLTDLAVKDFEARIADADKAKGIAAKIKALESNLVTKKGKIDRENAAEVARLTQASSDLRASIEETESVVALLVAIKATCPACQRVLKASEKAEITSTLGAKLKLNRSLLEEAERELKAANEREYPEEITQISRAIADEKRSLENIGDVAQVESQLRAHREAIVEMGRCDRDLKEIKDPPALDTSESDKTIDELTARIRKGEEVISGLREAEQKREAYKSWQDRKASLESRVVVLTGLIDFFGPNGIKSQMVGDKIGPFTAAINESLRAFGYAVRFTLEPYSFQVGAFEREGWRTLRQLSESEQFRFGVSFQIALAKATGLNFALIDRADVLDSDSRAELTEMLQASGLEQVIVFSTSDKPIPQEAPAGMKFVQLGAKEEVAA
jgi:DNA repair exonuclease SbcCD ATPase subunit